MGRAGAGGGGRASSGGSSAGRTGGGHSAGRTGGGHRSGTSSSSRAGSGGLSGGTRRGSFSGGSSAPRGGSGMSPPPPRHTGHAGSRVQPPPPRHTGPRVQPPPPRHTGPRVQPPPPRHMGPRVPPPPRYMGLGMPPPGGGNGGRPPRRGGGCLTTLVALFIVMVFAIILVQKFSFTKGRQSDIPQSNQSSTSVREKLATNNAYINDCVIDELGWFENIPKTESQLKNFWQKTGVQPYIILRDYDAGLTTDSEKEQWAIDYYDDNFDTENIFLFVYFAEQDTDNDVGYMAYANGYQTSSVMDSEAVEIFWDNIDKYWYTNLSTDDVIVNAFDDTADTIMH